MPFDYVMTAHCQLDRLDRFAFISEKIGWGIPYLTANGTHTSTRERLTNTGIILVLSADEKVLITAFPGTYSQVMRIYRENYGASAFMPKWLSRKIQSNKSKCEFYDIH